MSRTVEQINRIPLCQAYLDNMTEYLVNIKRVPEEVAKVFVKDIISSKTKSPNIKIQDTARKGFHEVRVTKLDQFVRIIADKILTPSGSVYHPTYQKRSIIAVLIKEFKAERKAVKKKQLKAAAEGRKADETILKALQNSIKVTLNSIPGSYGSPGAIFYDKGCYNGITSSGRLLISTGFLCCEQLLAGNISIFDVEEATNLLIQIRRNVSRDSVLRVMTQYNLKWVPRSKVFDYLNEFIKRYQLGGNLANDKNFMALFDSLSNEHLQFIWYHSNMKHICFDNEDKFKPALKQCFDATTINVGGIEFSEDNFWKRNGDIMAIAATVLAKEVNGRELAKIAKTDELVAKRLMSCCDRLELFITSLNDLFNVFMYHDINFQHAMGKNNTQRESVVVSDTDSVIFTVEEWGRWFTDGSDRITHDHYNISAFAVYILNTVNADAMAKFAISCGATGDDVSVIAMKSEYTYPTFMLYEVKKVYAALLAAQEGVHYTELRKDVKGSALKGLGSPQAKKFANDFLIKDVLTPVMEGNVSAVDLIRKVVTCENVIKDSLKKGELEYLPRASVGTADRYKDSDRSVFFYLKAWNYIFGQDYGYIHPPDKPPKVLLLEPTELYFEWLEKNYPKVAMRFRKFILDNKKTPASMFIEGRNKSIPVELLPLIDIKAMVYFNLSPCYLTLASLNIGIGHTTEHMLLGDIYDYR